MGFRFRKRVSIFPGVKLNFSKSGISTSIGVPGATLNLGRRGPRYTVGFPGTGLSYSERLGGGEPRREPVSSQPSVSGAVMIALLVFVALFLAIVFVAKRERTPAPAPAAMSPAVGTGPGAESRGEVTASALRCRADPSAAGAVIETLPGGAKLRILEQAHGWSRISLPTADCWVSSQFIG